MRVTGPSGALPALASQPSTSRRIVFRVGRRRGSVSSEAMSRRACAERCGSRVEYVFVALGYAGVMASGGR